jgi:hypothetical protein
MRWRKKSSDDKWFHAFGYVCAIDDYYFFSHSHLCIETYNDVEKIESPCRVFTASSASFIPQKPRADGNLYYIKEKNRGKSFVTSTAVGAALFCPILYSQGLSAHPAAEATSASTLFYYNIPSCWSSRRVCHCERGWEAMFIVHQSWDDECAVH